MSFQPKNERRCSSCRLSGHTKRSCRTPKKAPGDTSVFVQVHTTIPASPHVVDLRRDDGERDLKHLPVYEEPVEERSSRVIVDFAAMVRHANHAPQVLRASMPQPASVTKMIVAPVVPTDTPTDPPVADRLNIWFDGWVERLRFGLVAKRAVAVAMATILIGSLPFPAFGYYQKLRTANSAIVAESTTGFLALQSSTVAALSSNISQAQTDLTTALNAFGTAKTFLEKDHGLLVSVASLLPVIGTQVTSREHLLQAGHHLALGNTYIVKGVDMVQRQPELPLTERLTILRDHMRSALPQYTEALRNFESVDVRAIPDEYQESFHEFTILFSAFVGDMKSTVELVNALNMIFGADVEKRYLIMFQNNHELRPTGGFMGSFALLDVQKGKIINLDIPGGGTYDVQGQLTKYVEPPTPLQLINGRWEFQDANWFPDFAASAQKIEWFYQHSRSRTVDGVIAINATVLERLLRVVGPVSSDEYDLLLDHDTALRSLQTHVETKETPEKSTAPKAVLADILDQFMHKLRDTSSIDAVRLMTELHEALEQKEIQLYMNDASIQQTLRNFGWTGEVAATSPNQDYLMVNYANIAGQKSDARIQQTISHEAVIDDDGSVINTVIVERKHTGDATEAMYGAPNISYARFYVPEGSELIAADGFSYPEDAAFEVGESWYEKDADLNAIETSEQIDVKTGTRVTKEFGKTVFGNWVITMPGEVSRVYIQYKLPFRVFDPARIETSASWHDRLIGSGDRPTSRYSLVYQRQSGITSALSSRIIYGSSWLPVWRSDDTMGLALNGATYETAAATDQVVGLLMQYSQPVN